MLSHVSRKLLLSYQRKYNSWILRLEIEEMIPNRGQAFLQQCSGITLFQTRSNLESLWRCTMILKVQLFYCPGMIGSG